MEDGLVLGYDLCEDYCRISCYQPGEPEPLDIVFSPEENTIQTVLCRKRGSGEWLIGQEAYRAALDGEGIMVDKLLRLAGKDGTATIEGICYSAKQLLGIFLKMTLDQVYEQCGSSQIKCMVVTMQRLDETVLDLVSDCLTELGIRKEVLHMNSHTESFLYFVLSQKRVMWSNLVVLFDLTCEGLHYYEMSLARGIHPNAIKVHHEKLEEGFSLDILENNSGRKLADSIMLSCSQRLMNRKMVSSVYLSGNGMENCQTWAEHFLQFACSKRKVFYSDNLFSKGAVHAALDYTQKNTLYPYTFLCEGRIPSTVSVDVVQRGSRKGIVLAQAGSNWYDAKTSLDLILDHMDVMQLRVTRTGERSGTFIDIPLDSFPVRPNKTTKVRTSVRFHSEEHMHVIVEDKGFGEFFPASGAVVEKSFDIW